MLNNETGSEFLFLIALQGQICSFPLDFLSPKKLVQHIVLLASEQCDQSLESKLTQLFRKLPKEVPAVFIVK